MEGAILFVEGRSDRLAIHHVYPHVEIICTNGTMSEYDLEQLVEPYEEETLYTFFDRDASGDRLRAQFDALFINATHLHVPPPIIEVAEIPPLVLSSIMKTTFKKKEGL
ncbi:toprim domain-containing protein [Savagea sp. SN6]|uniref:Toprim domain-containing protein n=1 Tax=Savagea serpentis TaxID=2785297 RepID=A0A8J7GE14_9BACL|nr:toprim domain-containing protein [Savagea serpentis]MBF4501906.1 toprim domain-containing protein [Savagea serpentis]